MNKLENKGLFATAILLLGLFFLGYYSDKKEENSITEINIEDTQSAITENIEE